MATLTFLGSSAAVPAIGHDNTYLALESERSTVLIDCAGSPLLKLQLAGIEPLHVEHVVLTHRHPDHIYGFPILMLGLWLLERTAPLEVVADAETLRTARDLLGLFRPEDWPGFIPPSYRQVPLDGENVILDLPDLRISATGAKHLVPAMSLRIESKTSRQVVVYSGDTEPTERLVRFAHGADVLIHDATGESPGHSSPAQAGRVAREAAVGKLYLAHYPALTADLNAWVAEAQDVFGGPVELARDFSTIQF